VKGRAREGLFEGVELFEERGAVRVTRAKGIDEVRDGEAEGLETDRERIGLTGRRRSGGAREEEREEEGEEEQVEGVGVRPGIFHGCGGFEGGAAAWVRGWEVGEGEVARWMGWLRWPGARRIKA
jgi:hypothetical protein